VVYRKGELSTPAIDREWPYHIALPARECTIQNLAPAQTLCREEGLSLCPRHHEIADRANLHIVFCFAVAEHARRFQARFGGFRVEASAKARMAEGSV
jgi:hypothetical protein